MNLMELYSYNSQENQIFKHKSDFNALHLQRIPNWWKWLYYICPTAWSLNGLLTSQYGDLTKEMTAFGKNTTVDAFMRDYYGFHHNQLNIVALTMAYFPLVLASLFSLSIWKLNFQRRQSYQYIMFMERVMFKEKGMPMLASFQMKHLLRSVHICKNMDLHHLRKLKLMLEDYAFVRLLLQLCKSYVSIYH